MTGIWCCLAKAATARRKCLTHPLNQGWRGDRLIAMLAEKSDHLAANLQGGNVGVQVDAIQALEVQHDMPIENLIDVADRCHHAYPRQNSPRPSLHFTSATGTGTRRSEAGLISRVLIWGPVLVSSRVAA